MSGQNDAILDYATSMVSESTRALIRQACFDLYNGPVVDDPQYPGFSDAVDTIRSALEVIDDIYYESWSGCWSTVEPSIDDADDTFADLSEYSVISASTIKATLCGSELAKYL